MTTLTFPQPQTKTIWPEQGYWTYEDWLQLPNDGFQDEVDGAPDLVVEVLSPSNWTYDRGPKQEAYWQAGVQEYWIVDYRTRKVEVLILEEADYVLVGKYKEGDMAKSAVSTDFSTPIAKLFAW